MCVHTYGTGSGYERAKIGTNPSRAKVVGSAAQRYCTAVDTRRTSDARDHGGLGDRCRAPTVTVARRASISATATSCYRFVTVVVRGFVRCATQSRVGRTLSRCLARAEAGAPREDGGSGLWRGRCRLGAPYPGSPVPNAHVGLEPSRLSGDHASACRGPGKIELRRVAVGPRYTYTLYCTVQRTVLQYCVPTAPPVCTR